MIEAKHEGDRNPFYTQVVSKVHIRTPAVAERFVNS